MSTTTNRPSAPADASLDHRLKTAPEAKATPHESIKRLPETAMNADERVKRPPDGEAWRDERIKRPPATEATRDERIDRRPETEAIADEKRLPSEPELRLALPPDIEALLGPPPLIPGEDRETYDKLLLAVAQAIRPRDVIEWLSIKHAVDSTWAEHRLKRLQTQLLSQEIESRLCDHLERAFRATGKTVEKSAKLAAVATLAFITHDQAVIAATRKALPGLIDLEAVTCRALVRIFETYESLDRMVAIAAARSQAAIRELDRRREDAARRGRLEQACAAPGSFAGRNDR